MGIYPKPIPGNANKYYSDKGPEKLKIKSIRLSVHQSCIPKDPKKNKGPKQQQTTKAYSRIIVKHKEDKPQGKHHLKYRITF